MKKLYDISVKSGTYVLNGEQKNKYVNIGAMMETDKGPFLFLNAHANLAAFPRREGSESVIASLFEPRDRDAAPSAPRSSSATPSRAPASAGEPFNDDIPF